MGDHIQALARPDDVLGYGLAAGGPDQAPALVDNLSRRAVVVGGLEDGVLDVAIAAVGLDPDYPPLETDADTLPPIAPAPPMVASASLAS